MRFLIIDDSSADRELNILNLRKEFPDAEFLQVSRDEGLDQALEKGNFDIVLTDYQLNWTDGLHVLHRLKQRYPEIPVLMVTGTGNEEVAVEGLRSGLSNYILKSQLNQLPQAVRDSLEKQRLQKQYDEAIEQLRHSEERYREIFEQGLTAIFVADAAGNILTCNPAFARVFGCSSIEEAREKSLQTFYPQPEEYQKLINLLRREKLLKHHEAQMRRYDGGDVTIIGNIHGTFDQQGNLTEVKGYFFDHTEQKQLAEQLQQAQRLESVGLLVSGIAHDFNNMLAGILGYAQRGLAQTSPSHPLHENLEHIHQIATRAANMTHQLLAFSRRQVLEPKEINLNTVVDSLLAFLSKIIADRIEIHCLLEPELLHVHADYGQIEQVLMNLCINARDAMPQGGKLTIRTYNVAATTVHQITGEQVNSVPYICISVQDTGIGMDKQTQERVFEPFFTTKEVGKGTGLGLSMVHGIVGQHGGAIHLTSTPNKGTTFSIYLPAIEQATVAASSPSLPQIPLAQEMPKNLKATILVVEDDPDLRFLMEAILSDYGYTVMTAENGLEGLHLFEQANTHFDLIISDLITPKMTGKELYQKIHVHNNETRFLFVSGYQANQISENFILEEGFSFLAKPFSLDELASKVQELIVTPTKQSAT